MRRSESPIPQPVNAVRLPVRAVLLDVDDTLLDTTSAMYAAATAAIAAVWPGQDPAWHRAAGVRFRHDPGGYFVRYTAGELDFVQMRSSRLAEVAAHHGLDLPSGAVEMFEDTFRPEFLRNQRRYDDVLPFLDACRGAGLLVGALTNSSEAATTPKLLANELTDRFAVVVTRDTCGFGKPDPRVFRHACAQLGAAPAETAYIGDEWAPDIDGARGAGLQPVWLRRGGDDGVAPAADVPVITSLAELRVAAAAIEVLDLGAAAPTG